MSRHFLLGIEGGCERAGINNGEGQSVSIRTTWPSEGCQLVQRSGPLLITLSCSLLDILSVSNELIFLQEKIQENFSLYKLKLT